MNCPAGRVSRQSELSTGLRAIPTCISYHSFIPFTMKITNMTLPDLVTSINPGNFGQLEGRESHYGAINLLVSQTKELFGEDLIAQIRAQPLGRAIQIPIFNNYDHTILTVRSCEIVCQDTTVKKQTIVRTHIAIDICINPDDYADNYVQAAADLRHRYKQAKIAVYKKLDEMGFAYIDLNKDTTMVPDAGGATPNANPLFKAKAGAYEVDSSLKFYSYLSTILDQLDISGPFVELTNPVANADRNILSKPGGGAMLDTDSLMQGALIQESEHSNRVAPGTTLPVHYVMPVGSVGVLNMIDLVYQRSPVIGSEADMSQWDGFENKSDFTLWGQTPDEVFNEWDWGVLQKVVCVDEQKQYKVKFSADFAFARDFTSKVGESPIKRFDVKALAAV